ncbi:glycosyltransferase [Paenibacillus sp.]|uniref:glycosyltransferase n=1 Tax=Paenibacillus sp. TaxID=58172 RepID=UPI002D63AE26|nr:glycosyltransferase [Paenibacillus sp.]HZG57924.1 glycosyltransferase [Paenibacillus sp.]
MISVIISTNRPERMENVFRNYARQRLKDKEMIVVLHGEHMDADAWRREAERHDRVSVYTMPKKASVGACKNFAVRKAKHRYVAKFDDDDYYGSYYLSELYKAFKTKKADVVGKSRSFAYVTKYRALLLRRGDAERGRAKQLRGPTIAARKSIFKKVKWPDRGRGGDKVFLKRCVRRGLKLYATGKYNFVYIRGDRTAHTWGIGAKQFMKRCAFVRRTDDYRPYVDRRVKGGHR